MGDVVKSSQAWAVVKETVEGVFAPPTIASHFMQVTQDGSDMSRSKESVERNVYTGTIGKIAPRTSTFQVSGSLQVEARAHSTQGHAPEADILFESALGAKHSSAAIVTGIDHTDRLLNIADTSALKQHDIVMIKTPGKFHVSPIASKTANSITLKIPAAEPFPNEVEIAAFTAYTVAESEHPSFSVSRYLENSILNKATGCKATSLALQGFSTGGLSTFNIGFGGLDFDQKLESMPVAPSYDDALPPIILSALVFMDDEAIDVNEVSFTLDNTLAYKTATRAPNGRIASRTTERSITGSLNPFMKSDSLENFNRFKSGAPFSLFAFAQLPSETEGEPSSVVAFYMPNCTITDLGESDQDGLMQDNISFSANRGASGTINELVLTFI